MRRFLKGCSEHRANLCLLASGALANQESAVLGNHLAGCLECQRYYEEVKRVAAPLAAWEKAFSQVETSPALEARWAKDFSVAMEPARSHRLTLRRGSVFEWAHALFWPQRRIWAGLAAVWLAILALNVVTREPTPSLASKAARPSLEMVRAYLEAEGFAAAEWAKSVHPRVAEPPKPLLPSPRSEQRAEPLGA